MDSRQTRPVVTRVEAVKRSKLGQWWYEKKRFAKPVAIGVAIVLVIVFVIIELVRLIF